MHISCKISFLKVTFYSEIKMNKDNIVELDLSERDSAENAYKVFNSVHSAMFGEISSMLRKAKLTPILNLRDVNPSFTAMVDVLDEYLAILVKLDVHIDITSNHLDDTRQYLKLVRNLAEAIDSNDSDSLGEAIAALDEKPYI